MTRQWLTAVTCVLCLAFVAFAPTAGLSQAVYGGIFGTVTDPTGAAVPGAKVTITSVGRGTSTEVTTNAAGNYTVTRLITGLYNIRAEASGFKAYEATDISVFADVNNHVDIELQVGSVAETVTVTAEDIPLLKTDRADVATLFTQKATSELPIFDRNFTQFTLLSPGTSKLHWQHASSENPQGSTQTMVNGQHFSGTSFQLDGTDNRDPILGIIVINPPLESITHTKVTNQNFDAEFGMAAAGVITAQTKSGTNEIHGSAYWFRRNDTTQARNPFTQPTRADLPQSLWNQFGGSIGAPIVKDKAFIFADYQGTRRKLGGSILGNVPAFPTAAARSTCLGGGDCDLSLYSAQIFNPNTGNPATGDGRTPYAGNIIPAAQISPQAIALLNLLPATNAGAVGAVTGNFTASGPELFDDDIVTIRSDYKATENLNIFGRYTYADFSKSAATAFGDIVGGPGLGDSGGAGGIEGGFGGASLTTNQSLAAGFDYVLNPNLLTDFRFGWFSYDVSVLPNGFGTTPATDAGIPGLNLGDDFTSGMPFMEIQGEGEFRFGYSLGVNRCNCPLQQEETQVQFVNNWTVIQGDHSFKFGADIRHARNLRVPSDQHRSGQLRFNTGRTSDATLGGGVGLATFLLGDVSFMGRYVSDVIDAAERQNRWFFYGQDTWRINAKWTFNYGVRWEIYFPEYVNRPGAGGWLDTETGLTQGLIKVGGVGGIGLNGDIKTSYTALGPRLGLAYQLSQKTVIRMGYGRSFDVGTFGSHFGHNVTQNLPVLGTQEVRSAGDLAFLEAFTFASGPPAFDVSTLCDFQATGTCLLPDGVFTRVRPSKQKMLTVDSWNFTVQHQITPTMSVEVAYVGNKGTHVFAGDGPDYGGNNPFLTPATFLGADGIRGTADDIAPNNRKAFFSSFGWTQNIAFYTNDADNHYNSLQMKLNKRLSNGLQFLAHYSWQEAKGENGDYFTFDSDLNKGVRDWDRTHVFVLSGLWEIPVGRGKAALSDASPIVDHILGGWQLNTIVTIESGLPFSPGLSGGTCDLFRDTGPCRPDLVGSVGSGSGGQFFETTGLSGGLGQGGNPTSAGPWALPAPGTFGNARLNSLRGPRFWQADVSLIKKVFVGEQTSVEFRAEAFNLFNHVNLANPNSCVDCGASDARIFGTAPGAQPRQWQFGLKIAF